MLTHKCRVHKGTGSQSVVVCVAEYPRGKSQRWVLEGSAKAIGYAHSYQQSGVHLHLGYVCVGFRYGQAVFILVTKSERK